MHASSRLSIPSFSTRVRRNLARIALATSVVFAAGISQAEAAIAKDFTLGPVGASVTVYPGIPVILPVTVQRTGGFKSPLTYKVTNPIKKVTTKITGKSSTGFTLNVVALRGAIPQTKILKITVKGGGKTRILPVSVNVTAGPGASTGVTVAPAVTVATSPPTLPATSPATTAPSTVATVPPTLAATTSAPPTTIGTKGDFIATADYKIIGLVPGQYSRVFFTISKTSDYDGGVPVPTMLDLPAGVTFVRGLGEIVGPRDIKYEWELRATNSAPLGASTVRLRLTGGTITRDVNNIVIKVQNFGNISGANGTFPAQVVPGGTAVHQWTATNFPGDRPDVFFTSAELPPGITLVEPYVLGDLLPPTATFTFRFQPGMTEGTYNIGLNFKWFGGTAGSSPQIEVSTKPRISTKTRIVLVRAGSIAQLVLDYEPIAGIDPPTYQVTSGVPKAEVQLIPTPTGVIIGVLPTPTLLFVPGTPPGSYPVKVVATSGSKTSELTFTLLVS
jgi:hypothetical protein